VTFIVDSSVALSWCFEDERTAATHALLERIAEAGALAPQHWPLEVLNGLMMGERRKRNDAAVRRRLGGLIRDLPVSLDAETTIQAWDVSRLPPNTIGLRLMTRSILNWRGARTCRWRRSIAHCVVRLPLWACHCWASDPAWPGSPWWSNPSSARSGRFVPAPCD